MSLSLSNLSGSIANSANYFIYALRRDSDDMLYLTKINTASNETAIDLHRTDGTQIPGVTEGVDYVEETTAEKQALNNPADKYQQIRFDSRNLNYFIDSDGYFVLKLGGTYDYDSVGPQ